MSPAFLSMKDLQMVDVSEKICKNKNKKKTMVQTNNNNIYKW